MMRTESVVHLHAFELSEKVEFKLHAIRKADFIAARFLFDFHNLHVGEIFLDVVAYGLGDQSFRHLAGFTVDRFPFSGIGKFYLCS